MLVPVAGVATTSPETAMMRATPGNAETEGCADGSPSPEALGRLFARVDAWVFDLDNTLYPPSAALWSHIERNITLFVMHRFGLDGASARELQLYYYLRHGTTLRGLVDEGAVEAAEYLDFVHDVDRSSLTPNPALAHEIGMLPGRKLIFTNGSRSHAMRTCERLGLEKLFDHVFDIADAGLEPKPASEAYAAFLERTGVDPTRAAMFEDLPKNLVVPRALGMTTVLVEAKSGQADHRDPRDHAAVQNGAADFTTDDLSGFLALVNSRLTSL